ncbi:hypothetical protein [Sandaracinobacteroides hominis]|uniref:hypothetical protein n=1 Tax=Sandaracinobacteroides hominis TaxID=2780086 RepID=UPI0018F327CE|nr:hypothetical protein [Sandaracinobacteroides hominis]
MHSGLRATLARLERAADARRPKNILMLFRDEHGVYRTLEGKIPIRGAMVTHCIPGDERL